MNPSIVPTSETSESPHRNRIMLKPLSTEIERPIHTIPGEKICGFRSVRVRVNGALNKDKNLDQIQSHDCLKHELISAADSGEGPGLIFRPN